MLDARFPGDMGHAGTWPFPVLYRVVPGATPARVVLDGAARLLPATRRSAQSCWNAPTCRPTPRR